MSCSGYAAASNRLLFGWVGMRVFPQRRLLRRRTQVAGRRRLTAGLTLLALAAGLVAVGQAYPGEVADVRARLAGPVSSMLGVVQAPLKPLFDLRQRYSDFVHFESELARLRAENDELKGWQWRAIELERQLADLSALNKVVNEPGFDYVTTRIEARSIGAQSHSLLVRAGSDDGVSPGAAVLNGRGLIGTTYEVGPSTSRVLLLKDRSARVLVSIGRGLVTAAAVGTGSSSLEILDGGRTFDIAVGDEVMTAGELGGHPRGLRVGRVVGSAQGMRVEPYADFDRLEFVSILVPGQPPAAVVVDGKAGEAVDHLTAQLEDAKAGQPVTSGLTTGSVGRAPEARRED